MRIALVAPPFIPVPPVAYGGTELFIAHLAEAMALRGHDLIVYANGQSRIGCDVRWIYEDAEWPLPSGADGALKNLTHSAWAVSDAAAAHVDVLHVNDALAVPLARFAGAPAVHTLHHPYEKSLAGFYQLHPDIHYVAISDAQRRREAMPRLRTIHHGIRLDDYRFVERKGEYLSFLGRIAPVKGPHLAIQVARESGIPLKIAGEIQPLFRGYWEQQVAPLVDGTLVEYVGEATLSTKNELLGHSLAMLFPIQWQEPFGLVMIEAMACGTPVLALPGGAVDEIVDNGVTGWICNDVADLSVKAREAGAIDRRRCREHVERSFSVERMAADYERLYTEIRRRRVFDGPVAAVKPAAAAGFA